MSERCPYCGEKKRAVKNHVRLASGDGHGPSGQYPDDFDDSSRENDNRGRAAAAPIHGDGGTVKVEAVEETEPPQEIPDYEEEEASEEPPNLEEDTDDEGIVAMPEAELNSMLEAAASLKPDGSEDDEETSSPSSEKSEGSSTTLEVDPVEAVENTDTEGWSIWSIILLLGLAVVVGVVWGLVKDAAQNGREQASQFAHRNGPDLSGYSTV